MDIYSVAMWFTPLGSVSDVKPPIIEGQRTMMWISSNTLDSLRLQEQARHKASACYGIEITDIESGDYHKQARRYGI